MQLKSTLENVLYASIKQSINDGLGSKLMDLKKVVDKSGLKGTEKREAVLSVLSMYKEATDEFVSEMTSRINRDAE